MSKVDQLLLEVNELEKSISTSQASGEVVPTPGTVFEGSIFWSESTMLTIAISVLVFGLIVIFLSGFLVYKGKKADLIIKLFGTPLIIISAVFLIVAGYTEKQIAPVVGLLGTIAGYLLGKNVKDENDIHFNENKLKFETIEKEISQIKENQSNV